MSRHPEYSRYEKYCRSGSRFMQKRECHFLPCRVKRKNGHALQKEKTLADQSESTCRDCGLQRENVIRVRMRRERHAFSKRKRDILQEILLVCRMKFCQVSGSVAADFRSVSMWGKCCKKIQKSLDKIKGECYNVHVRWYVNVLGICVTAARQTLTLFEGVQIPHSQPNPRELVLGDLLFHFSLFTFH